MKSTKLLYVGDYDTYGYSRERSELHEHILDMIYTPAVQPTDQPVFMSLWGGPNSAKSVALQILISRECFVPPPALFRPDALKELPEYQDLQAKELHPEKTAILRDEFYDIMAKALDRALQRKISIVIDDHGDNVAAYKYLLSKVQRHNQHVDQPHKTILMGQSIEPTYFMYAVDNFYLRDRGFYPGAIKIFQKLADTWPVLAGLYDIAVLNETTANLQSQIKGIAFYEHGESTRLDVQPYQETILAWKGVNPEACCPDELWQLPDEESARATAEKFQNYRRGMESHQITIREIYTGGKLTGSFTERLHSVLKEERSPPASSVRVTSSSDLIIGSPVLAQLPGRP